MLPREPNQTQEGGMTTCIDFTHSWKLDTIGTWKDKNVAYTSTFSNDDTEGISYLILVKAAAIDVRYFARRKFSTGV